MISKSISQDPRVQISDVPSCNATDVSLADGILEMSGTQVLTGMPLGWEIIPSASEHAVFLRTPRQPATSYTEIPLGDLVGVRRFTSGARKSPFWVKPVLGKEAVQVQQETLWILAELAPNSYLLIVPLVGAKTRYSLMGAREGLRLVAETGDPLVTANSEIAVLVAVGQDPYKLTAFAARTLVTQLGLGRLRADKVVPDFADYLGWCTWDAFYQDVSAEKVLLGLKGFAAGGIQPGFVILDDGWQSVSQSPTGEIRLAGFGTNERFADGLAWLVATVKQRYGVKHFLVWHALLGYWGGIDGDALPGYGVRSVARSFGPGILRSDPHANVSPGGAIQGVPSASEVERFFEDYHRWLERQGVDGVKVDNQAVLEAVSAGQGGRVALARIFRQGMEAAVNRHFSGRLINCMACTSECAYLTDSSVIMRTSDDFWPLKPETHGTHLYTNAQAAVWFGEFVLPDWDMFQSLHPAGAFHAAARAVAGGPIYVSDAPDAHDFHLLRKLVIANGAILRPDAIGRPSPDCLFVDPTQEKVLLKVFNTNRDGGVLGLFNLHRATDGAENHISGVARVGDVPPLHGREYAVYVHRRGDIHRLTSVDELPLTLAPGEWEIVSFAPIESGFAAFGLADKLNGAGAISSREWSQGGSCGIKLRDGGRFVGWTAVRPNSVSADGCAAPFRYYEDGRLEIDLPVGGPCRLTVCWP